jgi:hypothetical protein
MKKFTIPFFTLVFVTIITPVFGQNPQLNHQKYWFYKNRLNEKFIKVGPYQGESIPLWSRHSYGADFAQTFGFGDATFNLGYYIGMLATEFKLLKLNNKDYSATLQELFYALNAFNRLDYMAEVFFQPQPNLTSNGALIPYFNGGGGSPPAGGLLNGFFIRDDVPNGFLDNKPNLKTGFPYSNIDVVNALGDFILHPFNPPFMGFRNEISKDQVYGLLVGLSITQRCFTDDPNLNAPSQLIFMDGESSIFEESKNIMERILGFLSQNSFEIENPITGECAIGAAIAAGEDFYPCYVGKAGNCSEAAFPLAWVGNHYLNHPFSDYLDFVCGSPSQPNFSTMHGFWQVIGSQYMQGLIEGGNLLFEMDHAKKEYKQILRLAAITDSWEFHEGLEIQTFLTQQAFNIGLVLSPFFQLGIGEIINIWANHGHPSEIVDFNNAGINAMAFSAMHGLPCSINTFFPVSTSTTAERLKVLSHQFDHQEIEYLIHCFLFDKTPDFDYSSLQVNPNDNFSFEGLLNSAPCQGPHNYYNQDWIFPANVSIPASSLDWSNSNRWDNFSTKFNQINNGNGLDDYNTTFPGEYCGIDYMFLFNLYCLTNPNYFADYGNYLTISDVNLSGTFPLANQASGIPATANGQPDGSHSNPLYRFSMDELEADAHLLTDARIEAKAGNQINLTNGFQVLPGAYFSGLIGLPDCSDGVQYKSLTCSNSTSNSTVVRPPVLPDKYIVKYDNAQSQPKTDNQNTNGNQNLISPKPSPNRLNSEGFEKAEICVYDLSGKLILHLDKNSTGVNLQFDGLSNGMYILTKRVGSQIIRQKIIIQK